MYTDSQRRTHIYDLQRFLRRIQQEQGAAQPLAPDGLFGPETAAAVRDFLERIGVSKADSVVDPAMLEHCVREDLNAHAPRRMAVLDPLLVIVDNYEPGRTEPVAIENNPNDPAAGSHEAPFCRELFIERDDFMEEPVKKFFRLAPGKEVRLKGAYIIRCDSVVKDESGEIAELHCTADLDSRSGTEGANRKVKGTLHWLSASEAVPCEFRLYEPILSDEDAQAIEAAEAAEDAGEAEAAEAAPAAKDFMSRLNPNSLTVAQGYCEPCAANAETGSVFQFLRTGYFCKDRDSTAERPVFNRTVALKDSWAKEAKK